MGRKARPNDPCPCGSGIKFKKCCDRPRGTATATAGGYTQAERASALEALSFFVDELWEEEEEEAFEELWGRFLDREDELQPELRYMSDGVQDGWFAFDYEIEPGKYVVDFFLEQAELTPGQRTYLSGMRRSSMRLYEVVDTVPGTSITLRDLVEGGVVTVSERSASRTVVRHSCLAARVVPRGYSGRPEMDMGVLPIVEGIRAALIAEIEAHKSDARDHDPKASLDEIYKELPPLFHQAWLASIFEPAIPELRNTDDEPMIETRVSFHVDDATALAQALEDAHAKGIDKRGEGSWQWSGDNAAGKPTLLGSLQLDADVLTLATNSVERGTRGRALLEAIAGPAVRHRGTTHEDLRRKLAETLTNTALGREAPDEERSTGLDPDVAEALAAEHYSTHYRAWIDQPVPALDDETPRRAARSPALRPRLEELIGSLEAMYERALKEGAPAYDPSWMWEELDLRERGDASHPPALAHERVAERVAGSAEVARVAAERLRSSADFDDGRTVLDEAAFSADLELQRFVRVGTVANETGGEAAVAAPYLRLMVNFELHRRKAFWVDAALSYMLEHTDVDVAGGELRVPFASFAIAFTDRHALSLGERFLARRKGDPLRGHILRVITVYVTEVHRGDDRTLEITFAFDALGADLPSLARFEVPAGSAASVRAFLDAVAPAPPVTDPPVPDASPVRGLLRVVLNAILYATSAGVTPEIRTAQPRAPKKPKPTTAPKSSDAVYFLPGKIDIRSVRRFRELERAPQGRALLARYMVRGHWRRPQKAWTDQRLRWIEPYWKGPDMATVIEKAYRLRA